MRRHINAVIVFSLFIILLSPPSSAGEDALQPFVFNCRTWSAFELNIVKEYERSVNKKGGLITKEEKKSMQRTAGALKAGFLMGLLDANNLAYAISKDSRFSMEHTLAEYDTEINSICQFPINRELPISRVVLIANEEMKKKGE